MDTYDRIEELMLKRGEKQIDLSKATDISTGLLSQWKSRMQKPSTAKLAKVAEHYGVTTDYLINGSKNPPAISDEGSEEAVIYSAYQNAPENIQEAIRNLLGLK